MEAQRKEQEKLLAVEEARRALENAQNQRNVRQYNGETQQWEWVADSRAVEEAKRAVIDAEKALADYHSEQLYQAQKKAVEDQIAATQEAFEAQRDAWTDAAELVRSGALSVEEAMAQAAQAIQNAANRMGSATSSMPGGTSSKSNSSSSGGGSSGGGAIYSRDRPDMSRNEALAGQTVFTNGFNVTYDENGYATKATNPDHPNYKDTTMSAHAQDKDAALRGESWTPDYTGLSDWNYGNPDYSQKYDAGGVLHGLGGIKATTRDEAVLNPDHTEKFLKPQADEGLERVADTTERLMDLGGDLLPPEVIDRALAATLSGVGGLSVGGHEILTAARPSYSPTNSPVETSHSVNTTSIGAQYIIDGITLSAEQARYLTVEQALSFVRSARTVLPLYHNG